jgi:hypothetical protein
MMPMLRSTLIALIAIAGIAFSVKPTAAQDSSDAVEIVVRWYDTTPVNAIRNNRIITIFHNGQFDAFDIGKPLPPILAEWLPSSFVSPSDSFPAQAFINEFTTLYPGTAVGFIWNPRPNSGGGIIGDPPWIRRMTLDPAKHRFLSYISDLRPTNDAFIANEDPFEVEVFDSNGKFTGPLYVDVFGNQVMDAGLCRNDESRLTGLDVGSLDQQTCDPEDGVVASHHGLNGSYRNPNGVPQRVLGGTASYYPPSYPDSIPHYDAEAADFSRPGYKIGRLMITRRWASGESSGSYYSPERAGEGFNIEIVEPAAGQARRRILVYWYTFTPDGSGEQVWLAGMGEMGADGGVAADVEMYLTTGGEFASTSNPNLVDRQRWGTIRIGFGQCGYGRVFYYPDDPDWPTGDYFINRLSPSIEGLGWPCAPPENSRLILPED